MTHKEELAHIYKMLDDTLENQKAMCVIIKELRESHIKQRRNFVEVCCELYQRKLVELIAQGDVPHDIRNT